MVVIGVSLFVWFIIIIFWEDIIVFFFIIILDIWLEVDLVFNKLINWLGDFLLELVCVVCGLDFLIIKGRLLFLFFRFIIFLGVIVFLVRIIRLGF